MPRLSTKLMKWVRQGAGARVLSFMRLKNVIFFNQAKSIVRKGIYLANKYGLGGRDALIMGNYLFNGVSNMFTHDKELVGLGKISLGGKELSFSDPIIE